MSEGSFQFEDCLLKHHVRVNGWLPLCKNRRDHINAGVASKHRRRLRYFTFCAVGAIDVLMLDVARVIIKSQEDTFDTVCFFDKDGQRVFDTQKRIPGAIGFVGDFVETVLADDAEMIEEEAAADENENDPMAVKEAMDNADVNDDDPLAPKEAEGDTKRTRERQRRLAERRDFIKQFPFDIINLDLEEFLFKPSDPMPGKVLNAMRRVFRWQRRLLRPPKREPQPIDGFSLMFTTQIGPPNLTSEYLDMLRDVVVVNLNDIADLGPMLSQRGGVVDVARLESVNFDLFFKLGMPKVIARALMEEDWFVDPRVGIKLYEFERQSRDGPYKMLHLVTDVMRQSPPSHRRAPMTFAPAARQGYAEVVRALFQNSEVTVNDDTIDRESLQTHLDRIKARRKKYCPEE